GVPPAESDGPGAAAEGELGQAGQFRVGRLGLGYVPSGVPGAAGRQQGRRHDQFSRSCGWAAAEPGSAAARAVTSGPGDQAELLEGGEAVVQADLLGDEAVLDLEDGGA